jgi:hypothetical protein
VGYAAAVLYRNSGPAGRTEGRKKAGISLGLMEEEKKILRRIVLNAIEGKLQGIRNPPAEKPTSNL